MALLAGSGLGSHVRLVHGLVGQHGLPHDVANGEDVRHVGAQLRVDLDEATLADGHTGLLGIQLLAVGCAAHGRQHQVIDLRTLGGVLALETDLDAFGCGLGGGGTGLDHQAAQTLLVVLLPDLDHVAVGTGHHAVEHLDHVHLGAQRGIDGGHFQADDAAADDQHALGHEAQCQRAGGVDDAIILRQEGQPHGLAASRDDGLVEAHHLLLAGGLLPAALGEIHHDVVRIKEACIAAHDGDLAALGHAGKTRGHAADHFLFPAAQTVDVDLGLAELDAVRLEALGFLDDRDGMQKCLGRDAADVEADAAQGGIALDDDDLHAQIGGTEGSRITARATTDDEHVAFDIGLAVGGRRGLRAGTRCRGSSRAGGCRCSGRGGRSSSCGCRGGCLGSALAGGRLDDGNLGTLGDLVAQLDLHLDDAAGLGGGDLHGSLVGLHGDEALLDSHDISGLDQHLDDLDVAEVADVGHFQNRCHGFSSLRASRAGSRPAPAPGRRQSVQQRRRQ